MTSAQATLKILLMSANKPNNTIEVLCKDKEVRKALRDEVVSHVTSKNIPLGTCTDEVIVIPHIGTIKYTLEGESNE